MIRAKYSPQEIARRGEEIYARQISPVHAERSAGQFVVVDIESGAFEIAADDLSATKLLLAKRPSAVLYGLRIGQRAAYRLGVFLGERRL